MGHDSGVRKINGDKEIVEKRERGTSQPILMNIGIAIAFSFAGFMFSQIGTRNRPHSALPSLGGTVIKEEEEEETSGNLTRDECNFKNETIRSQTENYSETRSSSGDEEGYLLPEFNDLLLEEFGSSIPDPYLDPNPNLTRIQYTREIEKEVSYLRNLVCSLEEREKSLVLQLLDFSSLKEQEISIGELKNQLKVKNVETKLYVLKMGSLLSENQSLRVHLSENSRTMVELEEAREQIRVLREEMEEMQNGEEERLKRMEGLEEELKALKLVNACLEKEKLELVRELELEKGKLRIDATFHTSKEAEAIEEAQNLRREIEKLTKEIEQLKTSRCADLEELVYLKWINACLRYELREHQPSHGKTLARDLSITLSPNSKEKAKQLIQDYAYNSAGPTSSDDFYWEYSSESSGDSSRIGKLKYFLLGKGEKKIEREGDHCSPSSCVTEELAVVPVHLQREKLVRSRSDAGLGFSGNDFRGNGFDGSEIPEKTHLKRLADALYEEGGGWYINRRAASFSFY